MRCSSCGADNVYGNLFCEDCGSPLELTCRACGHAIGVGKRFCGKCGTPVESGGAGATTSGTQEADAVASPTDSTTVVAERRMCSVLFCDLVGFTTLSEDRDPEAVRELLGRYFDLSRMIVARYGGTVEKFIGDAVMAVWGTPVADEHDAERAVRAALELTEAVAALGAEVHTTTLAARAGVVTGVVAVNLGATGQGMVAGDAVNTASRIQSTAAPSTVLVDEGTRKAVGEAIAFIPEGSRALKGKQQPLEVWRVDRVLCGVGGSQRVDGLEAPMVGRNAELRLVKELFHASAERRTPKLVSVVGAAGVGKSRLGWEFEKYVDGLADTVWWHRGRCLSYGDGVAFSALAEMVRQRFGIAEDDTPQVAGAKLREGLPQWLDYPAELDYVGPRLGQLLGVDYGTAGPALAREELFAGWRLFLERIAAKAPVLMLVEDLHHGDPGLLDFVEHLLDWARDAPIFVLTLARPELENRRSGWGSRRGNSTTVSLDPLDEVAMDRLLDGLVPGMPTAAKVAVAGRAEGIPLYAVETVRMLIDRDVVQPIDGVYRLVGDVGDLAVPVTLHSLLAARLDAFDPATRLLIADASVLGGSFRREALVAISGLPAERVDEMVAELVRREVLAVRADPLSPERGQYAFVQAMFREMAYETQSRNDRKARHLAVAEYLESAFPDGGEEIAEVVACHVLDALAAVPDADDADALREHAVRMLTLAGERAERTGAPGSAVTSYGQAATLLADAATSIEQEVAAAQLWERSGSAAEVIGDLPLVMAHQRRAAKMYRRHQMLRDAARADSMVARTLARNGQFDEARSLAQDALAVLEQQPDGDTVNALLALASASIAEGADPVLAKALEIAQSVDVPNDVIVALLNSRGVERHMCSRSIEGVALIREAIRRAESGRENGNVRGPYINLSEILLSDDPAAAAEAASTAIANCRRIGERIDLGIATCNLMQALLLAGAWDEVEPAAEAAGRDGLEDDPSVTYGVLLLRSLRGDSYGAAELMPLLDRWGESQDPQDLAEHAAARCLEAMCRGDLQAALDSGRISMEHTESLGLRNDAVRWTWSVAAEAALALGQPAAVGELVSWLDEHPRGHQPPLLRAERARVEARLLARDGAAQAVGAFEAAVAGLRELGSPYHVALGLLDQAEFLADEGDIGAAEVLATEARSIAERLRTQPLLDRALRLAPVPPSLSAPSMQESAPG